MVSGDNGLPSKPQIFNGEQLVFEERTTDPSSTQEGEMWLRTDIAPLAIQLATLRFDNGSGTWDIPVFQTGTSNADVEEVFRVEVGGVIGYVPINQTNPAFSALGFQHAGARYALHNAVSTVPDSGLSHLYEFEDDSNTTVAVDSEGAADGTITGATYDDSRSYVGNRSLEFQNGDDVEIGTAPFSYNSLSVTAWVWIPSGYSDSDVRAFGTRHSAGSDSELRTFGNQISVPISGSLSILTASSISTDDWNYFGLSISHDAGAGETDLIAQINDSRDSTTASGSFDQPDITAYIGAWTTNLTLTGNLDQVRFYDRGLSAGELDAIFKNE